MFSALAFSDLCLTVFAFIVKLYFMTFVSQLFSQVFFLIVVRTCVFRRVLTCFALLLFHAFVFGSFSIVKQYAAFPSRPCG
jgi:hypothetical protein